MRTLFIGVFFVLISTSTKAQVEGFSLGGDIVEQQISAEYTVSERVTARLDVGFEISDVSFFSLVHFFFFKRSTMP